MADTCGAAVGTTKAGMVAAIDGTTAAAMLLLMLLAGLTMNPQTTYPRRGAYPVSGLRGLARTAAQCPGFGEPVEHPSTCCSGRGDHVTLVMGPPHVR